MAYIILDLETCALANAGDFVEPVEPDARLKDPVKIAESIKEKTAERDGKLGLDPDLCRIVALGYHKVGHGDPFCHLFQDEQEEKAGLMLFWDAYRSANGQQDNRLVTFYGHNFDLPVLMRRSLYLGVKAPALNLDRFKSPHIDLWQKLAYGYPPKAHSLQFYKKRFNLPIHDDVDGADIAALVKDGSVEAWSKIERHCMADVETTHALANKLGVLVL